MIIKMLPVKRGISFVIRYIADGAKDYRQQAIFHNLNSFQTEAIAKELHEHFELYGKKRKNQNLGLHVILSHSPLYKNKLDIEKMDDIASHFLKEVYPNAPAFAAHHLPDQESNHWHSHIFVSSRDLAGRSTRISKHQLKDVHHKMLDYNQQKHGLAPQIDIKNYGRHLHSEREYYKRKRNPNLKLTKDDLTQKVQSIFITSESSKDFYQKVKKEFKVYQYKGQDFGILHGEQNRKFRFSRLGIKPEQIKELDNDNSKLKELEQLHKEAADRSADHDREIEK